MLKLLSAGIRAGIRQPYLENQRRRRRAVRPLFLDWAVTWRCNARCIMCDTWRQEAPGPDDPRRELSLEEIKHVLRRDADFLRRLRKVGLTGGEPFLRDDLVAVVRAVNRFLPGARISIVSNGLMTKRILRMLEEIRSFLPGLIFSVSLDGLGPVHDRVRGIEGFYEHALATITGALEMGLTVTSGLTISHMNYDQITPVSQMLAGMGVDFSCNLQERGANFHNDGSAPDLTPEQAASVARDLTGFSHHYYMDNVRRQLQGARRTLPCYSGFSSYFLQPNGDVAMCNLVGEPMGNLRETSFARLAAGPRAWELRDRLAGCTCWSQCEVKNSAASAPLHVLKWLAKSPHKKAFLRHYAKKAGMLPS